MSGPETLQATLAALVPCVHMAWPEGTAPALPWAVWYLEEERGFSADDARHVPARRWCVELYERTCDYALHDDIEAALQERYGPCRITETWLADEDAIATVYEFEEIG